MTALVHFLEAHPWWTLVYLIVLSGGRTVRFYRGEDK